MINRRDFLKMLGIGTTSYFVYGSGLWKPRAPYIMTATDIMRREKEFYAKHEPKWKMLVQDFIEETRKANMDAIVYGMGAVKMNPDGFDTVKHVDRWHERFYFG